MKKLFLLLTIFTLVVNAQLFAEEKVSSPKIEVKIEKDLNLHDENLTNDQKDSILYQKLNPDQILELEKSRDEVEKRRIEAESKEDMPLNGFGIVMIVIAPFLFVVAIILISARNKDIESKRRYDLYMKSLEMGQNIPENFFEEPRKSKPSNLKRGIIALMVGLAFGIFLLIRHDNNIGFMLAALIPGFVGIGYILVHFLEKQKQDSEKLNNE
jgi:hypothetical protein